MSDILISNDGPVRIVTIDRPERRNAVDAATAQDLFDAFIAFDADASASVAILTGARGVFCAGAVVNAAYGVIQLLAARSGEIGRAHV